MTTNETAPVKPVLLLNTPVMVALFKEILLAEITQPGGKWNSASPKGHAELFAGIECRVKGDDEEEGITIPLLKNNYNFNDSNWVNVPKNLERLSACAKAANDGKDVSKKDIVASLEHIKNTLKKAEKHVVVAKPSSKETQEATAAQIDAAIQANADDGETIGDAAAKKAEAKPEKKSGQKAA